MQLLSGAIFKYASAGLLALCAILFAMYSMEKSAAGKWKARAGYYQGELARISTKRDEQKQTSEESVRIVERDGGTRIVERIIRVPNPENCATPPNPIEAEGLL